VIRLLAFCDDPAVPTGFGKVADHVLRPLVESGQYEVNLCAINYKGDSRDPARHPYRYWAPYLSKQHDWYGINRCSELIQRIEPDMLWILNDLPIVRSYFRAASDALAQVPVVTYSPVDGDPFPATYLDGIRQATIPVVYTEYARGVVADMDEGLGDRLAVIPHGHDPSEFYPLDPDKAKAQEAARAGMGGIDPSWFIVLRVDKNQERKSWPATLRVFAAFAERHPEARLWCHTVFETENGYDLAALCEMYGIADKVLNSGLTKVRLGVPVEILNYIYNVADVHLSTTSGGGWELSTHEAKAAGTPTIITDYAAMSEVGAVGGELIPYTYKYTAYRNTTEYAMIDEGAALDALEKLYAMPGIRYARREAGLAWAESMTWQANRVAERFDELFREAIATHG